MKPRLFFMMLIFLQVSFAETRVQTTVDKNRIRINESLTLKVTAKESDDFPKLKLTDLKDFTVISGPGQSSSFQWVNGKMSSSKMLSWTLIPNKIGNLIIPSFSIDIDGKLINSEPIEIIVVESSPSTLSDTEKPDSNDNNTSPLLFLVAEPNKKEIFQGEQVTVDYKIYTRVNMRQYAIESKPQGVGFWQEELYAPKQPTLKETSIDGVRYRVATLYKVALFPINNGPLEIEPMILNCSIEIPSKNRQFSLFNDFFSDPFFSRTKKQIVSSKKLKIDVKPVPQLGKPADYTGAVGRFEIKASVDTARVPVNEAITLNIELSGTGNFALFQLPEIQFPSGLEVFSPKVKIEKDPFRDEISATRTWEYILIPRTDGQYILPSIKLDYFEPSLGRWESISSNKIPILATPSENTFIVEGGLTKEEISLLQKDIRYIRQKPVRMRNSSDHVFPMGFWYINILAIGIFFTPNIIKKVKSDIQERSGTYVKHKALKRLKNELGKIKSSNDFQSVEKSIYAYFSTQLGISEVGLDSRIIRIKLLDLVDSDSIQVLEDILAKCGLGQYAKSAKEILATQLASETIKLIMEIDKQL